jgi:hypothetical protein
MCDRRRAPLAPPPPPRASCTISKPCPFWCAPPPHRFLVRERILFPVRLLFNCVPVLALINQLIAPYGWVGPALVDGMVAVAVCGWGTRHCGTQQTRMATLLPRRGVLKG